MAAFDETPILDLGRNPIPGGAPCGTDCAEDETYLFVQAEFGRFGRMDLDPPDWWQVSDKCQSLLSSMTKDMQIASVYAHALFEQNSYPGLAAALGLMLEMVRNFWADMFPQRERRRKARIEAITTWFAESLADTAWANEHQPKSNDFDAIDACITRVGELEAALKEKMPDDAIDVGKFVRNMKQLAAKRPKAPAPQAEQPAASQGGGGAPAAPAASGGGGGAFVAAGEPGDVGSAQSAILAACTFIKKTDPTHPFSYAITRVIKWSRIQLPTSDEAKYQIESPDAQTLDALQHQFSNGVWEHLLNNAEGAFRSQDPLWLDLQRYSCAAMKALGPTYDRAREAIIAATAGLYLRLGNGLFDLRFKSGTPLCSGETRMWIETDVAPSGGGGGGGDGGNAKLNETFEKARGLAGSGKLKEGLSALFEGLSGSRQRRDQFLYRLKIAQLCYDGQKLKIAAPMLEECRDDVLQYKIGEWEPSLAVDVARTLYKCQKAILASEKQPTPEMVNVVRDAFSWLCQLDPLAALEAEPT